MAGPIVKNDVFQAIAHPTRREMMSFLGEKELPIVAISKSFPISRTAVNKHLQVLMDAGLVSRKRVGRETRFKLQPEGLTEVKVWLSFFDRYWDERLASLKSLVETENEANGDRDST